jgi:NADPH2:quinone reductase
VAVVGIDSIFWMSTKRREKITNKMEVVAIEGTGGVDALKLMNLPKPSSPAPDQVLVKVHYSSVNFIDTYYRTGLYKIPKFPYILGNDASGVVEAVGSNVKHLQVGDRVALYANACYAEYVLCDAAKVAKVPDNIELDIAVACIVNGMTAHYLTQDCYPVSEESSVLIHAASGSTGQLVTQLCAIKKAKSIIGTVGSEEKAKLAHKYGATHTILYKKEQVDLKVREIIPEGVDVVYDSIGKLTWEQSLKSLRRRGDLVLFGNTSGAPPPINPLLLMNNGSLRLSRPKLNDFIVTREEMNQRAQDLFRWIGEGKLRITIHKAFNLQDARLAHQEIESGTTVGKIVLRVLKSLRR